MNARIWHASKPLIASPKFIPVVLSEQLQPGTFEFTLDHLIDHELDFSALDARFRNDRTGAPAYDPRVVLKIVLLAYSRGLIQQPRRRTDLPAQRAIHGALRRSPPATPIAKFVRDLGEHIKPLFTQVLLTCDRMGLIGKELFAIDGVKLPATPAKNTSGTHAELLLGPGSDQAAAARIIQAHRDGTSKAEPNLDARRRIRSSIRKETQAMRSSSPHAADATPKASNSKNNATDNDSAKMATSKGVIQGLRSASRCRQPPSSDRCRRRARQRQRADTLLPMVARRPDPATSATIITR